MEKEQQPIKKKITPLNVKQRQNLNAMLDKLSSEGFWGKITISFQDGLPVHVDKNESVKL